MEIHFKARFVRFNRPFTEENLFLFTLSKVKSHVHLHMGFEMNIPLQLK